MDYPYNIRGYDTNPRSPFYDDGGYDLFIDSRISDLMDDTSKISPDYFDEEEIAELSASAALAATLIGEIFSVAASRQAEDEWAARNNITAQ